MAFGFINKLKHLINEPKLDSNGFLIYSPISGEVIPITDVPDVVFSEKIAGDGVAIKPTGNVIVSPVDGVVSQIFETNHCLVVTAENGIEVLIHFGIDTVELRGQGFKRVAEKGQSVRIGDPLIELDLEFLEKNAKSTITPVVISNVELHKDDRNNLFGYFEGTAVAGTTQILSIGIKKSE
jgi:PTS system glucose-specific IIA component